MVDAKTPLAGTPFLFNLAKYFGALPFLAKEKIILKSMIRTHAFAK